MSSYNKVLLMGNLTRDPEVRSLPSGQAVTELGIASNRTFMVGGQGGKGGEKKEEVTFVDVSFWGRKGEVVAQYFKRGDPIFIEGRLSFRQWQNKEGEKRSKLSVTGENFEFINGRRDGAGSRGDGGPPQQQQPEQPQQQQQQSSAGAGDMEGFDEVPF